jgi:hypothetical protein
MNKLFVFLLLAGLALAVAGCGTPDSGSRQYVPGQGWVPNN